MLTTLLTEMDGFKALSSVLIQAATSAVPALLQWVNHERTARGTDTLFRSWETAGNGSVKFDRDIEEMFDDPEKIAAVRRGKTLVFNPLTPDSAMVSAGGHHYQADPRTLHRQSGESFELLNAFGGYFQDPLHLHFIQLSRASRPSAP